MATPAPVPIGDPQFVKNAKFLEDQVSAGIEVSGQNVPAVAFAIAGNQPFPTDVVHVGSLPARVSGETGSIRFTGDKGVVSFKGGAGVKAGLGAYTRASALLADLDPDNSFLTGVGLPQDGIARY